MSTSLLYHAFGIRGYEYVRTDFADGQIEFTIRQDLHTLRCPHCGSRQVRPKGRVVRQFRCLPIGGKPVKVRFAIARVACDRCRRIRQVRVPFADPRRSYTRAFERYALELSRSMTIKDVAAHLQVSWDVVKDIQKRYLRRRFARPKLKHLRRIAIDEISTAKGHHYATVVLDLDSGAVVFVGEGKHADALKPFWKRLRASRARVEAVAIDMSLAYIEAVSSHLPNATIVFDHFHIIKGLNDRLTTLRQQVYREVTDRLHKAVLKGTRWLLLKNPENLDSKRNEAARLEEALQLNRPLAIAYYLKEDLRQLWQQPNKRAAQAFLTRWIVRAQMSGIRVLQSFANTLALHRWGILAWYDYPISTGPLEGTNNKIKTMRRQAYGFRDPEFFRLKILGLHETRYALVG
jgi:transposase